MNLLIADDSSLIRSNLTKLILQTRHDISVKGSEDVEGTVRELGDGGIDVLILDLEFPDGSGFDVLRRIGKSSDDAEGTVPAGKRPYIIVLTNHARERLRSKSLRMGADLFFDKTHEYERVVDVIRRL